MKQASPKTTNCIICGQLITLTSDQAYEGKKLCSRKCISEFRSRARKGKPVPNSPVRVSPTQSACVVCGATFNLTSKQAHQEKKTCSVPCQKVLYSKAARKRNGEKPEATCERCGKVYQVGRYERRMGNRFCSDTCRLPWFAAQTPKGENCKFWRGGQIKYYGSSWRAARRAAWARDSETCQECGKSSAQLGYRPVVHHKIPFRLFGVARHEEANQLDNLICLCRKCHVRIEWTIQPLH